VRAAGLPVHVVPAQRTDAEGLLDAIAERLPPAGRRFLFPCAEAARDVLPAGLTAAGARVDCVTLYRTLPSAFDAGALRALLRDGGLDALTFTSPSAAESFASLLDAQSRVAAKRCIVAAIGPVTAAALDRVGLPPDVVAARADLAALVAALGERLHAQKADHPAADSPKEGR